MLDNWRGYYNPSEHWADQPGLRAAIYKTDVRVCPLPTRYNYIPGLRNRITGKVKIFHNRLNDRLDLGYKDVPPDQLEQVIQLVNRTDHARVTFPRDGEVTNAADIVVRPSESIPFRIAQSVFHYGPIDAFKFWFRKVRREIGE